jgi:hypothetical protein
MKKMKIDRQAVVDVVWNWADWLGADTIASATVVGTGCTVDSSSNTTTTVTGWISSPTANATVTCHITTAGGRQDDRTIVFDITER